MTVYQFATPLPSAVSLSSECTKSAMLKQMPNFHQLDKISGFTILETMVAITIASILIAAAVPSFQESIEKNRIINESQRLSTILKQTRNTAITSSTQAFVCRTSNAINEGNNNIVRCRTGGFGDVAAIAGTNNWSHDVVVYTALPGTNVATPNNDFNNQRINNIYGTDRALREAATRTISVANNSGAVMSTSSNTDNVLRFNSDGSFANQTPFRIAICNADADAATGRLIEITQAGLIRTFNTDANNTDRDCSPTSN